MQRAMRHRYLVIGASILLGLVFLTAGASKLADQSGLVAVLVETSVLGEDMISLIARCLPWLELVLGLCLLLGIAARLMASASLLLTLGFIFHNVWIIKYGFEIDSCGCLGIVEKEMQILASSEMSLYLDIGMLLLSLIILLYYPGKFLNPRPWFRKQPPSE